MPSEHRSRIEIVAQGGYAVMRSEPQIDSPRARYSLLSPGTERRQITGTSATGETRPVGYMTIRPTKAGCELLACGHTNQPKPKAYDSVTLPLTPETDLPTIALARFQLMAAAALAGAGASAAPLERSVVIGGGAVGLGAAFELLRLGSRSVSIVSAYLAHLPALARACLPFRILPAAEGPCDLIIDAAGKTEAAIQTAVDTGASIVSLISLPSALSAAAMYQVQKKNLRLVGLYELTASADVRQELTNTIAGWIGQSGFDVAPLLTLWAPAEVNRLFGDLLATRLARPFNAIAW